MPCILHILHLCSICPGISLNTHLDCCFCFFYCQYTGNFMLMLYILEQSLKYGCLCPGMKAKFKI